MAAITFPASPSVNDYFTSGTKRWQWDGTVWKATPIIPASSLTGLSAALPAGTVLQTLYVQNTSRSENSLAMIPNDDTIPQIGEGTEILSLTITPSSSTSKILINVAYLLNSTGYGQAAALFRSGLSDALSVGGSYSESYGGPHPIAFLDSPATTSPVTYSLRMGAGSANICNLNCFINSHLIYNYKTITSMFIQEIKA